jgi:hypothetical protein
MRNDMAVAAELPETILTKTREGKLDWERLSSGGFVARIANAALAVDRIRNTGDITLRITNEEGLVVETFSSQDRPDSLLEDLYELARRQALRVDETLSNIKRSLDAL